MYPGDPVSALVRSVLWEHLHGTPLHAVILNGASFIYHPVSLREQKALRYSTTSITDGNVWSKRTRCFVEGMKNRKREIYASKINILFQSCRARM